MPLLQTYLAVMAGGALGSALRMAVALGIDTRLATMFPLGTVVVNVIGCFVIGIFAGLTGPDGPWLVSPILRHGVMVGVLGGFTTFSSFSLQTLNLASQGEWLFAGLNVVLSVVLCLAAVWLGAVAASALSSR